jgi:hypothetical protein
MLSNQRQVSVILRFVIDNLGRLTHGEVVDLSGRPVGRFNTWPHLAPILRAWVRQQPDAQSAPENTNGNSPDA